MGPWSIDALPAGMVPTAGLESPLAEKARPVSELDDIDALVRTYQPRLLRFVLFSTGDQDLAESITQDTLLKAYRGRENFRGDCSVNTWLTGIALNVIRDHLRTEKFKFWRRVKSTAVDVHEMASFIPAAQSGPEGQVLAREKVQQMYRTLETLSQNQRTVFLMKFIEEMEVDEISTALGMSINTVRTHLHRALKVMRSKMGATL